MALRKRLTLVVFAALTLAGFVAMVPGGGWNAGAAPKPPASPRCTDVKALVSLENSIASMDMSRADLRTYKTLTAKLSADGCDAAKTCVDLNNDILAMRNFRVGKLTVAHETQLTDEENAFLLKYCSS